jgi:dipeptidyl aminopeptidase/acylaminoacyl peptidase
MRLLLSAILVVLLFSSTITSAKIVFSLWNEGVEKVSRVYVMDDNGKNKTMLTDTQSSGVARWSQDGRQILFSQGDHLKGQIGRAIVLKNADDKSSRQLTGFNEGFFDRFPLFLPDRKSILFVRFSKGVRVMNLESNEIRVIGDFLIDDPDISPNGKYIVYSDFRANVLKEVSNIWIMNADSSNRTQLLPPAPDDGFIYDRRLPRWDRYGNRIVFMERRYKVTKFPPGRVAIQQGFHYFICDLDSRELRELEGIPIELEAECIDWMDNDNSLVFSACKRTLFERDLRIYPPYSFYKYHIATGETSVLAEHLGEPISVDWIRDDAHSISQVGKLSIQWGKLKQK